MHVIRFSSHGVAYLPCQHDMADITNVSLTRGHDVTTLLSMCFTISAINEYIVCVDTQCSLLMAGPLGFAEHLQTKPSNTTQHQLTTTKIP